MLKPTLWFANYFRKQMSASEEDIKHLIKEYPEEISKIFQEELPKMKQDFAKEYGCLLVVPNLHSFSSSVLEELKAHTN